MAAVKCPSCDAHFEEPAATPTLEVISEHDIAKLRLACFQSIVAVATDAMPVSRALEEAERLYNWCMELEEERGEPDSVAPDDQCERKH